MNQKNLLFFKLSDSSFILNDEKFLQQHFQVHSICQNGARGFKQMLFHIRQLFFLITHIKKAKYIFIWFAEYHAFLPLLFGRVFNKPSFLVIGGFDAEKNEELNYGAHLNPFRSWIVKKCCDWTTRLLPVSKYSEKQLFENTRKDYSFKSKVIYNGVDSTFFTYDEQTTRNNLVTTVCGGNSIKRLKVKGIDYFVDLAKSLPEVSFRIVGLEGAALAYLQENYLLNNVEFLPPCTPTTIRQYLQESKVICQLSRFESFGMAVVEGMLCGCIPVVTRVGGLPEIVETTIGYIIEERTIDSGKQRIREAINTEEKRSVLSRDKAIQQFEFERRKKELLKVINKVQDA